MICLKLNWFLRSKLYVATFWICMGAKFSVWDVFNNFLLIVSTDRSKISSDQKRFFIALSLYPLSFFANTPFNDMGSQTYWPPIILLIWVIIKSWSGSVQPFCRILDTNKHPTPAKYIHRYRLIFLSTTVKPLSVNCTSCLWR